MAFQTFHRFLNGTQGLVLTFSLLAQEKYRKLPLLFSCGFVIRFVIGRKDLVISLHASLFLLSAKALFLRVTDDSNPLLRKCLFLYITTSFFHPLVFSPFTMPFHTQCLKNTEKVAFNIASEASYVYILIGQKLIKNTKNGQPVLPVLPDKSLLIGQKICGKFDIFSKFQST